MSKTKENKLETKIVYYLQGTVGLSYDLFKNKFQKALFSKHFLTAYVNLRPTH